MASAPVAAALDEICAPIVRDRDAIRVPVMGDTGAGKSFLIEKLVRHLIDRKYVASAFVLDDKRMDPQYTGYNVVDPEDFAKRPPSKGTYPVVVFRGSKMRAGATQGVEGVASLALDTCTRSRVTSVVVVDEFGRLISSPQQWLVENTRWKELFREGRSLLSKTTPRLGLACGVSCIYSTLSPQDVPRDGIEQVDGIVLMQMAGLGLGHLKRVHNLPEQLVQVVPNLQRGQFVFQPRGVSTWSGRIYGPHWPS